jgi:hypothetical protein
MLLGLSLFGLTVLRRRYRSSAYSSSLLLASCCRRSSGKGTMVWAHQEEPKDTKESLFFIGPGAQAPHRCCARCADWSRRKFCGSAPARSRPQGIFQWGFSIVELLRSNREISACTAVDSRRLAVAVIRGWLTQMPAFNLRRNFECQPRPRHLTLNCVKSMHQR